MTNKDVIEYVQNTPYNTNPAILNQMLKEQDYNNQDGQYDLIFEFNGQLEESGGDYSLDNLKPIPKEKFQATIKKLEEGKATKILFRLIGNIEHIPRYYAEVPMHISFYSTSNVFCDAPVYFDYEGPLTQIIRISFDENGPTTVFGL